MDLVDGTLAAASGPAWYHDALGVDPFADPIDLASGGAH